MWDLLIIVAKILLSIILGGFIGLEREALGKPAGSRTYALIALGSAFYTILAIQGFNQAAMAGQIIVGIGFIGAGMIIFHKQHIEGLTTAAGLWATAAIGMAVGIGWYAVATITSILIFLLLFIVRKIEFSKSRKNTLWTLFDRK